MKIIYEEKDINNTIGYLNKHSFLRVDAAQSGERWGLPIFKKLKFNTEAEVWKDPRVKKAAEKAKAFCNKKGWSIPTVDEAKKNQASLLQSLKEPDSIAKGLTAKINNPRLIKYNGLLLATCSCSFSRRLARNRKLGEAIGLAAMAPGGIAASAAGNPGGAVGILLGRAAGDLLAQLFTTNKGKGLFSTFVGFKKDNDKIKWYLFGYFLVGDIKDFSNVTVENAKESLSLEDLILGEGIGDAAEKITVEGDVPDPEAPETPVNNNTPADIGGVADNLDNTDGDQVIEYVSEEEPTMTKEEAEASFEALVDPDYIDDSLYPFMV